ncbi:hypothetical protein [uncultured Alistipes sp.]|jgi:hypothetical protein|uniref:hypothetical protein n=1 Tax=uncultured Alistipes sp. TaxID=538949 RepID=UPI0025DF9B74|nr:hypothetical protein [uncultured Alistipes sp.]
MKRLFTLALLLTALCISPEAFAQKDKVVAASGKKRPAWIGKSDQTHFAVTEVGKELSEASNKCMASIRQHIINAVAVNVSSAETMTTRNISRDQLITVMNDYSSVLMTEAGKLPYLNNITLSNAEDTYWERIYSKKTKTYRYEYSVLYPFTEQTRRQLIDAFVAIDDAKQAEYDRLRAELSTITNIDRIQQAVNELEGLADYFFDATRKSDVETLKRNYLALYNTLSIQVESETRGICVYSLQMDGRRATTSREPRLASESATEMVVKPYGDKLYMLTYNPEYASASDINKIEIGYAFGGARVSRTIYFDPSEGKVFAQPRGMIRLEQTDGELKGTLQLRVNGWEAQVRQLVLWNPADGARFTATQISPEQLAAGDCTVNFEMAADMARAINELDVVKGSISIYNPHDQTTAEINFTLPYKLTIFNKQQ